VPTYPYVTDLAEDLEPLADLGGYENADAVLEDAIRALLGRRPEFRLELAVEKYRRGTVSLNRAAELAGVSTEEFKTEFAERGIPREAGYSRPTSAKENSTYGRTTARAAGPAATDFESCAI
jgi:predicted HTH domain antitoxin